jgi:hypothetical protein
MSNKRNASIKTLVSKKAREDQRSVTESIARSSQPVSNQFLSRPTNPEEAFHYFLGQIRNAALPHKPKDSKLPIQTVSEMFLFILYEILDLMMK